MKRAVSISLGSRRRDHAIETTLLGVPIRLERVGCDGNLRLARERFLALDGQVDAFGVGGADLQLQVEDRVYPLYAVQKLVAGLRTPAVDGGGIRRVVERQLVPRLEAQLPVPIQPRRVLIGTAVARYDLACSFEAAGYEAIYGDFGFGLGLPIPIRSLATVRRLARLLMPIMGRLPFHWLYPTGDKQDEIVPRFQAWYRWATVIADDFHYLKKHLPERLDGKIVVTNTTTPQDVELLRERGVAYLCTITPRLEGRTFGTNVMEAALTAIAGQGRPLTPPELRAMLREEDLTPTVLALNP
ncbi:MAG: hypothetical protein KatS3mg050_2063 [Litorilinea sp.]|nr:MAG: hypothetical protein KatS3mg050_2063 [Litorilinea sp.]